MGQKMNACRIFVGTTEGKKARVKPRRRCVDNIKVDLRERIEWCGLDQSGSEYGPVEGSCEHGREPSGSVKYWEVLE
jgi:hypothetical protein